MKVDLTTEELATLVNNAQFAYTRKENEILQRVHLKFKQAIKSRDDIAFTEMTQQDKLKNILAFLVILFGDDEHVMTKIMDFSPSYLIEKYERYIESPVAEYDYGMHPSLRQKAYEPYARRWGLK